MSPSLPAPAPFLEVLLRDGAIDPALIGLCAGFEGGRWRAQELARHAMEWLPEFALTWNELQDVSSATAAAQLRKAATLVYASERYRTRGEFGELLLHIAIRQSFDTIPGVSKIYFKDSLNTPVLGFDCVHIVHTSDRFELWLGEAKFYGDLQDAIREAVKSVNEHVDADLLRKEAMLIGNKVDPGAPFASLLKRLLHTNTSLDVIFDALCVPVFITYDSAAVAAATGSTAEYREAFAIEVRAAQERVVSQGLAKGIRVELILLPLKSKAELVQAMHEALERWQAI